MGHAKNKGTQKASKKKAGKNTIREVIKQTVQPPAHAITPPEKYSKK